jgi:hypothetical protein
MVGKSVWEGKGKNNLFIYMTFVLIYCKGVGSKSCWNQHVIDNTIYIEAPTQVQMPMLWKIVGKQI